MVMNSDLLHFNVILDALLLILGLLWVNLFLGLGSRLALLGRALFTIGAGVCSLLGSLAS